MQSPLKYPCLPAVPPHSTPLRMPCSCKNANKACVDYDLIDLVAYFEHVQQQQFTLIFLWVGLCDLPADERMPVFPQHSDASAFPNNLVNLSGSNRIVCSYVACALRHIFKKHLSYTNTTFSAQRSRSQDLSSWCWESNFLCGAGLWELTVKLTALENALGRFLQGTLCTVWPNTLFGQSSVSSTDWVRPSTFTQPLSLNTVLSSCFYLHFVLLSTSSTYFPFKS